MSSLFLLVVFSDVSSHSQGSLAISTAQREKRFLNGIIQNLLPAVGPSVKSIVLAYSSTVSSKMVCSSNMYFDTVGQYLIMRFVSSLN